MAQSRKRQSNKAANKQESQAEEEVVALAGNIGSIQNFAGTVISLNQKRQAFFGVGDTGRKENESKIWLTKDNWYCTIPEGLSAEEVDQLARALQMGIVKEGKHWIPPVDKVAGTCEKYAAVVLQNGPTKEAKQPFIDLVKTESTGGYTAQEILKFCQDAERKGRSRPEWIRWLQEAIDHCTGPEMLVEDFPNDPGNYTAVVDPATMQVVQTDAPKDDLKIDVAAMGLGTAPSQVAQEALEDFLG